VIDYAGDATGLKPEIDAPHAAEIDGTSLFHLPGDRGTRLTFVLTPNALDTAEIRVVLRDMQGTAATPVWLHRWTRGRDGGV
jgi:glucans biosynthesis protein